MSLHHFLNTRLPIIQAPMAGSQGARLAVAVCAAGGLGSVPAAMLGPPALHDELQRLRSGTAGPVNLNFFCHATPAPDAAAEADWKARLAPFYAEAGVDPATVPAGPGRLPFSHDIADVVEPFAPAVVSFHFGLPDDALLERVRRAGAMVLSSATTVEEARWLDARGVDAIIAQGVEAGGHRGMFLTDDIGAQPGLYALLPQVVDAVGVPVIAAGGIADGRGIAAAFALGAAAAQLGTAYLLTPQAGRSAIHRQAVRAARDDATRLTNLYTGRPARGLLTRFMREQGPMSAAAPAFPLATGAVDPLRVAVEKTGSGDFSLLWSGEAAAMARETDAEALTRQLWDDALDCAAGLRAGMAARAG